MTAMPEWTADALDEPGHANPIKLSTFPADGSLRTFVPVWVVRLDDSVYVRSYRGEGGSAPERTALARHGPQVLQREILYDR